MFTTNLVRSWVASAVAGAVLLGLAAPSAFAQRGRSPYSVLAMLQKKDTATELKLTDEQQKKIEAAAKNTRLSIEQTRPYLKKLQEAKTSELRAKVREEIAEANRKQSAKAEADALAALTPDQKTQFTSLRYREAGTNALLFEEVLTKLDIKDDQKKKLEELQRDRMMAWYRTPRRDQLDKATQEKFKAEWDAKAVALLSPSQQDEWKKLGGNTVAPKTDDPKTAKKDTPKAAPAAPVLKRSIRKAAGPFVASFDPPNGAAGSKQPTTTYGKGPINSGEKRFLSFNFENAPWKIVLEYFAKKAGLTLDATQLPPDTFNYRDLERQYTVTEALDIMNGYLVGKNFILIRNNKLLSVRNLAEPIPPSMIPDVDAEDLSKRGRNELMRVVFKIKPEVDVKTVTTDIESLISPTFGKAVGFGAAGLITVTDIGSSLRRIQESLKGVSEQKKDDDPAHKAFECKHIVAADAAKILTEQLDAARMVRNVSSGAGGTSSAAQSNDPQERFRQIMASRFGGGGPGGFGSRGSRGGRGSRGATGGTSASAARQLTGNAAVRVTADPRTNSVLVLATARQIRLAEGIMKAIDVPVSGDRNIDNSANRPYFKVYRVYNIDPAEATKTLSVLMPDNVINDQAVTANVPMTSFSRGRARTSNETVNKGGNIHTIGTATEHQMLAELIREMDGPGESSAGGVVAKTIKLKGLDAVTVGNVIVQMYAKEGTAAPSISGTGQLLFVRGLAAQVNQIEKFIEGWEANTAPSIKGTKNLKIISAPDAEAVLQMIQQMGGSKIRVIVPNKTSPVRDRRIPSGRGVELQPAGNGRTTDRKDRPLWNDFYRRTTRIPSISSDALAMATPDEQPPAGSRGAFSTSSVADQDDAKNGNGTNSASTAVPPVQMTVMNGQIVIRSDDPKALAEAQQLIEQLIPLVPATTRWTVFYLQAADCSDAAMMLEQLFPSSTVSTSTAADSGSMFGGITGGISQFANQLGTMSGLNQLGTSADTLKIIPEPRSNALFVSGPSSKVRDVEQMLKVLDETELPGTLRDRVPRMIPVRYADVNEVANNVRQLYGDMMQPAGGNRNQINPLAMLMNANQGGRSNGRGGRGGRGGNSGGRPQPAQLTLSVDDRTGQLLVSCNDTLYSQIEDLVYRLDVAAAAAQRTTRVVRLENAQPSSVTQALTAMYPNVTVSVTSNRPGTSSSRTPNASNNPFSNGSSDSSRAARALMFQQMMQGGQQGGNDGGGRGGRFGGGGGSPFGGGGRGGFGGGGGRGGSGAGGFTPSFRSFGGGGGRGGRGGRGR